MVSVLYSFEANREGAKVTDRVIDVSVPIASRQTLGQGAIYPCYTGFPVAEANLGLHTCLVSPSFRPL